MFNYMLFLQTAVKNHPWVYFFCQVIFPFQVRIVSLGKQLVKPLLKCAAGYPVVSTNNQYEIILCRALLKIQWERIKSRLAQ